MPQEQSALISRDNIAPPTIVEGDAGIILKPDGSFRIFNTIDFSKPLSADSMELGKRLVVLAAVLRDPKLQERILAGVNVSAIMQGLRLNS